MTPPGGAAGLPQPWDWAPVTSLASWEHEHLSFHMQIRTGWGDLGSDGVLSCIWRASGMDPGVSPRTFLLGGAGSPSPTLGSWTVTEVTGCT